MNPSGLLLDTFPMAEIAAAMTRAIAAYLDAIPGLSTRSSPRLTWQLTVTCEWDKGKALRWHRSSLRTAALRPCVPPAPG